MDRQYILDEIRRTARENGGVALGRRRFEASTGIRQNDYEAYWPRFSDAVVEAGLEPNRLTKAFSEPLLLDKLARLTRDLGRVPVYSEIRQRSRSDPDFPNAKVFQRLGKKAELVKKLHQFCVDNDEFQDVAAMCAEVALSPTVDPPHKQHASGPMVFGSVYLMKSGRHYKIGRTNAVGRRERELAIQLPEQVKLVHTIKTDDPVGIEAYWHRRFADRRGNGEWFKLTAADVAAFKRRKFM